jgi:hypothetical protein
MSFDASTTDPAMIKAAITEPYFDQDGGLWRTPPFTIHGYDPLNLDG